MMLVRYIRGDLRGDKVVVDVGGASDGQRMMELNGGWVGSAIGAGGKVLERDKSMVSHVAN